MVGIDQKNINKNLNTTCSLRVFDARFQYFATCIETWRSVVAPCGWGSEDLTMRPAGLWAPVWDLLVVPVLSLRNCGQLQPGHGQHFLGHGQNMGYGHLWPSVPWWECLTHIYSHEFINDHLLTMGKIYKFWPWQKLSSKHTLSKHVAKTAKSNEFFITVLIIYPWVIT